jgi:hypothetical protein
LIRSSLSTRIPRKQVCNLGNKILNLVIRNGSTEPVEVGLKFVGVSGVDIFGTASQEPGEINVAGVGETKFAHLCETLPYVEVESAEQAVELVRGRITARRAELEATGEPGT